MFTHFIPRIAQGWFLSTRYSQLAALNKQNMQIIFRKYSFFRQTFQRLLQYLFMVSSCMDCMISGTLQFVFIGLFKKRFGKKFYPCDIQANCLLTILFIIFYLLDLNNIQCIFLHQAVRTEILDILSCFFLAYKTIIPWTEKYCKYISQRG